MYIYGKQYSQGNTSQPDTVTLSRLSQHADAATFPLGCLTDAAVYQVPGTFPPSGTANVTTIPDGITPGEIVSILGEHLGPPNGVQPSLTPGSGYPTQLSSVQVRFDNQTAPLLYVQDSQINAVAPWSLTPGGTTHVCIIYSGAVTNLPDCSSNRPRSRRFYY